MTIHPHDEHDFGETGADLRRALAPTGLEPDARQRFLEGAGPALRARGRARVLRRTIGVAAMAATLALASAVLVLAMPSGRQRGQPTLSGAVGKTDLNADGVIDILDAHALARAVDGGGGVDLDGDGLATRRDADWLAGRVVHLGSAG